MPFLNMSRSLGKNPIVSSLVLILLTKLFILGDFWSYNSFRDVFVVSPEPEVSQVDVDSSFCCLIFASDGVWDKLSPQQAVNSVYSTEKKNERKSLDSPLEETATSQAQEWINPSKRLVDRALGRWRQDNQNADNTSALTVLFCTSKAQVSFSILSIFIIFNTICPLCRLFRISSTRFIRQQLKRLATYHLDSHPTLYLQLRNDNWKEMEAQSLMPVRSLADEDRSFPPTLSDELRILPLYQMFNPLDLNRTAYLIFARIVRLALVTISTRVSFTGRR